MEKEKGMGFKKTAFVMTGVFVIAGIATLSGCGNDQKEPVQPLEQPTDAVYYEDAIALVDTLESTHPAFIMEDEEIQAMDSNLPKLPENYETEKERYLETASRTEDRTEFLWATKRYLTTLEDGHTIVRDTTIHSYLKGEYRYQNEKLYLMDGTSVTPKYLTAIGGVPIEKIKEFADLYYVAENEAARKKNYETAALGRDIFTFAGCTMKENGIEATYYNEETQAEEKEFVPFQKKNLQDCYNYKEQITSEMIGNVYYVDLNVCLDFYQVRDEAKKMAEAVQNGVDKFIIDVRNNPGGQSNACTGLINALGMEPTGFGIVERNSELSCKLGNTSYKEGFAGWGRDLSYGKKNPNIKLVVLQNENSFSSAVMLTTWVQDGDLGVVIGQPSTNAPTSYGDILEYTMEKSGIELIISYKLFLRPDANADQTTVVPDIVVDEGEDSLEYALEYLKSNERN